MRKKQKIIEKFDVVHIIWDDAAYENLEHIKTEDAEKCELVRLNVVGFLIHETKKVIIIAQEYSYESDSWRHITTTPKNSIVKRRKLCTISIEK